MGFFKKLAKTVAKTATGAAKTTAKTTVKVTRKPRSLAKRGARATGIKPKRALRRGIRPAAELTAPVRRTAAKGFREAKKEVTSTANTIQDIVKAFRALESITSPKKNFGRATEAIERISGKRQERR